MKNAILLIVSVFLFEARIHAQSNPIAAAMLGAPHAAVQTEQSVVLGESRTSFHIHVVGKESDFSRYWKAWIKKNLGHEGKKLDNFHAVDPLVRAVWSSDTLSFLYRIEKDGDFSSLTFLVQRKKRFITEADDADILPAIKREMEQAVDAFYLQQYDVWIADYQKEYDGQKKDLERVMKKQDKTAGEIRNTERAMDRARSKEDAARNAIQKSEGTLSDLNSRKEKQARDIEQTDKDLAQQEERVREKQVERDAYNRAGELDSKKALRVEKDLNRLRSDLDKLKSRKDKEAAALSKTERTIIKAEEARRKAARQQDDSVRAREEQERRKSKLQDDLKDLEKNQKEEEAEVEAARIGLEKMKEAKARWSSNQ
jgi:hypothetical protein